MFGPDKCGMTSKIHFIIRLENPKNGTITVSVDSFNIYKF